MARQVRSKARHQAAILLSFTTVPTEHTLQLPCVCRAYEPRFGTVDNPIEVPALLNERIIGVTDPEDDTLVIWGVIKEGEPPKQLVAGGEFFVLKRVDRIERVADKLGISH
jgi:cytochrome c oxidase subunit 5b